MIFTDDYTPFHNEADYCEEKNETQDKQIEELSNKLKQLKDEVQEMQNLINGCFLVAKLKNLKHILL